MAYGIFIFVLFIISYHLNLKNTSSVNTVIGAHFLMEERFTIDFVINELLLVLIGITIAIIFNMFHLNKGHKKGLIEKIQYTEKKLQDILEELALFLMEDTWTRDVWVDIDVIKKEIKQFRLEAYYYRENTFDSRTGYYMEYFEMRLKQCEILDNLHSEMLKIRSVPIQAKVVADYILYLKGFVDEDNNPEMQLVRLYELLERMREEPLPISREEFETRAILYHMLMDLEEFVIYKSKYYEAISYIASK